MSGAVKWNGGVCDRIQLKHCDVGEVSRKDAKYAKEEKASGSNTLP